MKYNECLDLEKVIMPKLKTKSAAKKRFKLTATGKLCAAQAGKNHFMRSKSKKQSRNLRGTNIVCKNDAHNVIKYFLPYGSC